MKISIIDEMDIISLGNFSILKLCILYKKMELKSNTMWVTVMIEKQCFPPQC